MLKTPFDARTDVCVDMKKRCDRNYHCEDLSDEQNCTFALPLDYDETVSPPKIIINDNMERLTDINISVNIIDVIGLNEVESKFQIFLNGGNLERCIMID